MNNWIGLIDDACVRTVLMLKHDDDARNFQWNEKTNAVRADFFKPNGSVQRRTYTQSKSGKWNLEFKVLPKPPPVAGASDDPHAPRTQSNSRSAYQGACRCYYSIACVGG